MTYKNLETGENMKKKRKLYRAVLKRLCPVLGGWHNWFEVAPMCVWGINKSDAMFNIYLHICEGNYTVKNRNGDTVVYSLCPDYHERSQASGVNFYLFWVVGHGKHVIVPAKNESQAKKHLLDTGVSILRTKKGQKIKITLHEKNLDYCKNKCSWYHKNFPCGLDRPLNGEGPSLSVVDDDLLSKADMVSCPLCGEENPRSLRQCLECDTPLHESLATNVPVLRVIS